MVRKKNTTGDIKLIIEYTNVACTNTLQHFFGLLQLFKWLSQNDQPGWLVPIRLTASIVLEIISDWLYHMSVKCYSRYQSGEWQQLLRLVLVLTTCNSTYRRRILPKNILNYTQIVCVCQTQLNFAHKIKNKDISDLKTSPLFII